MEKKKGDICIINKALFTKNNTNPNGITVLVNTRVIIDNITDTHFCCTSEQGYKIDIELEHDCSLVIITDNKKINKFRQQLAKRNIFGTNSDLLKIVDDEIKFMDNKFKTEIGDFNKIGINFKKLDLDNCSYKEIEDERNNLIYADDHGVRLVDEELQYLKELTAEFIRRGGILENYKEYKESKTITKHKIWTVECIDYSDGSSSMKRTNDGFNILELKGLVALLDAELHDQFKSIIKPDVIKRETIID